jgi:hypothetical protein
MNVRRLARTGVPIAGIVLAWSLVALPFGLQGIGGYIRDAGVLFAGLVAVRRGIAADLERASPGQQWLPGEAWQVFLAAGGWFLLAGLFAALPPVSFGMVDTRSLFSALETAFAPAFAWAGVGVVLVYVVASLADMGAVDVPT